MLLVCGLMLLLLQTAACLEHSCSFIESDQICYAALGHKLNLLMVLDTSKYDLKIQKRINNDHSDPVCRVKNGKKKEYECDLFNNRPEVTVINGALIINPVIRTDSGDYTVTLRDINGTEISRSDLQVIVEAPIGSVEVSLLCSSSGVMSVSCSSDGDQLLYSWTLNGQKLMDGNTIDFYKGPDGNLTCRVRNHISDGQETVRLKHCPGVEHSCFIEADQICYAALGHKLNLLMVLNMRSYDLKIRKRIKSNQDDPVCRVKTGRRRDCDLYNNRPEATVINGNLIINPVIRTDSGNYTVKLSDISGKETSRDLQVIVEAPIGSVEVSLLCSFIGMMRASCSSDGDQLLYSWTLNGQTLMDGNSSIELNEITDGNLTCEVKNHISEGENTVTVKPCAVPMVFVLVWCLQLMVLLGLFIGFHIYMRLCSKHVRNEARRSKAENEKI